MFFLIRPVGFNCQAKCHYCYYKSFGIDVKKNYRMNIQLMESLIDDLANLPNKSHTFCLHGGEPLLIGKHWFKKFLGLISEFTARQSDISLHVAVQTNGLVIDDEWVSLFYEGGVGISISVDGPEIVHDSCRIFNSGIGTHNKVINNINLMAKNGIPIGAIAVLTSKTLAIPPHDFFSYFQNLPLKNGLDITPYIETGSSVIEQEAMKNFEANPEKLTLYLKELFDLWLFQPDGENRLEIRMFEQLVGILLGFMPTLCSLTKGASCGRTPSILPNGDVIACDLDFTRATFRLGSLKSDPISVICSPDRLDNVQFAVVNSYEKRGCTHCSVVSYCGLTCPRHTFSDRDMSGYCRLMNSLVNHAKQRLNTVSKQVFSKEVELY